MNPIRILHCIPTMEGGGAERQLAYLAPALSELGWEVHVALHRGGANLARLARAGVVVHQLSVRGNYDPRLTLQLARLIRRSSADIVHTWLPQMDIAAGCVAVLLRTPLVVSERSAGALYNGGVKTRLRRAIARGANAIVANSPGGARYWADLADAAPLRVVIPNGLPLEEIEAVEAADLSTHGIGAHERVVLYAGRFSPEKNVAVLLDALEQIVLSENVKAVLCGEGPLHAAIAAEVTRRGLAGRVALPGYVDDLWAWMKRADVFVSIGSFEGHPNATLEALACGCRIVVSDIDAHRSFLDKRVAVLVNPGHVRGVRDAIARLLQLDTAAAEAMSRQARDHAQQWSMRAVARQYDDLYRFVLAGSSAAVAHDVSPVTP